MKLIVLVVAALAVVNASPFISLLEIPGKSLSLASAALGTAMKGDLKGAISGFADIPIKTTQSVGDAIGLGKQFEMGTGLATKIVGQVSGTVGGATDKLSGLQNSFDLSALTGNSDSKSNSFLTGILDIPKSKLNQISGVFGGLSSGNPTDIIKKVTDIPLGAVKSVSESFGNESPINNILSKVNGKVEGTKDLFGGFLNPSQLTDALKGKIPDINGLKEKVSDLKGQVTSNVQNLGELDLSSIRESVASIGNDALNKIQASGLDTSQIEQLQQRVISLTEQLKKAPSAEKMGEINQQIQGITAQVQDKVKSTLGGSKDVFSQYMAGAQEQINSKLENARSKFNEEQFEQVRNAMFESFGTIQEALNQVTSSAELEQVSNFANERLGGIVSVIDQFEQQ